MIRYTLSCENDHRFESWFQSGAAFDTLQSAGMISCAECSSKTISKTIMAPAIPKKGGMLVEKTDTDIAKIKDHIEKTADDVGGNFCTEARAMHDGEKPERAIYGQANAKEAKSLIEDGIPVLPLPFIPKKQTN